MSDIEKEKPFRNPNRARDHLANERTYLAWIRTAVSLERVMHFITQSADEAL